MIGFGQSSLNISQMKTVANKASSLIDFIQEIKYSLVLSVDKKVILNGGEYKIPYNNLTKEEQSLSIEDLINKEDIIVSTELIFNSGDATILKSMIEDYESSLLLLVNGNENMIINILSTLNTDDKPEETWESYHFYDMPAVGALTLLSKFQSDIRMIEYEVLSYLSEE